MLIKVNQGQIWIPTKFSAQRKDFEGLDQTIWVRFEWLKTQLK